MKEDKPGSEHAARAEQARHRVRLPGFTAEAEIGLGDVVKRATSLTGIRPCGPCLNRATSLNRWMVFSGRR